MDSPCTNRDRFIPLRRVRSKQFEVPTDLDKLDGYTDSLCCFLMVYFCPSLYLYQSPAKVSFGDLEWHTDMLYAREKCGRSLRVIIGANSENRKIQASRRFKKCHNKWTHHVQTIPTDTIQSANVTGSYMACVMMPFMPTSSC